VPENKTQTVSDSCVRKLYGCNLWTRSFLTRGQRLLRATIYVWPQYHPLRCIHPNRHRFVSRGGMGWSPNRGSCRTHWPLHALNQAAQSWWRVPCTCELRLLESSSRHSTPEVETGSQSVLDDGSWRSTEGLDIRIFPQTVNDLQGHRSKFTFTFIAHRSRV